MPPAFNLSQDQTLQFKFDLINRIAIVLTFAPHLRINERPPVSSSLKVIAKVVENLARPRREPKCMSVSPACLRTRNATGFTQRPHLSAVRFVKERSARLACTCPDSAWKGWLRG